VARTRPRPAARPRPTPAKDPDAFEIDFDAVRKHEDFEEDLEATPEGDYEMDFDEAKEKDKG
jgi:hypothetical protein